MPDQPAPWRVTSQRQDFGPGPDGSFVAGMIVQFTTAAGNAGSVFLPLDRYTVEAVRAAIVERAAVLDAVGGLTG